MVVFVLVEDLFQTGSPPTGLESLHVFLTFLDMEPSSVSAATSDSTVEVRVHREAATCLPFASQKSVGCLAADLSDTIASLSPGSLSSVVLCPSCFTPPSMFETAAFQRLCSPGCLSFTVDAPPDASWRPPPSPGVFRRLHRLVSPSSAQKTPVSVPDESPVLRVSLEARDVLRVATIVEFYAPGGSEDWFTWLYGCSIAEARERVRTKLDWPSLDDPTVRWAFSAQSEHGSPFDWLVSCGLHTLDSGLKGRPNVTGLIPAGWCVRPGFWSSLDVDAGFCPSVDVFHLASSLLQSSWDDVSQKRVWWDEFRAAHLDMYPTPDTPKASADRLVVASGVFAAQSWEYASLILA